MEKVLVVDDSATVRQQVIAALVPAGFEVIEAADGRLALEALKQHTTTKLVICDVNMPNMNGLEFLRQLANLDPRPSASVVMLTSEGRADLIEQAKKAGARGWLVKPFKPEQLVAVARKLSGMT
jgi:two-component system chemotaxis response regulator CheY